MNPIPEEKEEYTRKPGLLEKEARCSCSYKFRVGCRSQSFFIMLYLVFMFVNTWERSLSPRLEAHSAFLVLFVTSVYSYFVDTKTKGKPDAYSLISTAAFSIMSLGLSTLSPFGFEVDLLYFFCGVLIVQLMKIKLWLVIVGGGFSYSLIILRSTLDPQSRSEYHQLGDQNHVAIDIGSHSQSQSQGAGGSVSSQVNSPQAIDNALPQADATPLTRGLIRTQFMGCIEELKKENGKVIDTIFKHVSEYLNADVVNAAPEIQTDDNLVADVLPLEIILNLREAGRRMFQNECCNVYSSCRREFLKECLSTFGLQVEDLNVEDIEKMEKIQSWIKAMNLAVRILFPNERILCNRIFSSSYAADISFGEICKELTTTLLRFANTLATEDHSLLNHLSNVINHLSNVIPNVYKTLGDLIPDFNKLFFGQLFSESLRNDAILVGKRLGIFVELDSIINREMAQETVPDGGIHPATHKLMDYLRDVFADNESFSVRKGISSFSYQVARIIQDLDRSLEDKSKNYTDPALGCVFMINNLMLLQYGEDIYGVIFGHDWYKSKINQNIELYQRSSWDKILNFLNLDGGESLLPDVVAESMINKLKLFNHNFNQICKVQSAWFIFDEELREQMIKSVENILLPAYGNFLGKFHDVLGKDAYDFIQYGMQNIQDRLSLLFLNTVLMLTKIQNWLLKPKVWNFLCYVSSVVGLFCYALSSSFNHLFGKWTFFIISLAVLFAKAWERSTTPCVEAHTNFFILLITSVYSFYFDKEVKGKPDAYNLVSCVAFAIMSLGLSRLSHFGFEVDLLYFFCGILTVQLMKIRLWLVIIGGSFSYFLIILRSTLDALLRSGYVELQVQDHVVIEMGSNPQETSRGTSQVDSTQAITGTGNSHLMIIRPQEAHAPPQNEDLRFLVPQIGSHSQEGNSDSDNSIMTRFMGCIQALKKENVNVIDTISKHVDEYLKANVVDDEDHIPVPQVLQDDNLVLDALPSGTINDLRESTRLMVATGFEEECCRAYCSCRKEFLNESLSTFGLQVQELNKDIDEVKKIQCWIKTLNVVVGILFPNERRLCDRVFEGSVSSTGIAFREVYTGLTIPLLGIVNALAICSNSSSPFSGKFLELRNLILTYADKVQATVPGGRLHPITREVMNYIRDVSINRNSSLGHGLEEYSMIHKAGKLSLSLHIAMITKLLERSLKTNSKNYDNPTLGYVFIMNNQRFIELEAKLHGLGHIIGHDWLRKNRTKLQRNLALYHRSSWNKIVDFLKLDINESPTVAAELMKDKLHYFNDHFDEICNVQSTWFVFDEQLREQIIKSIENILLPAYGNFVNRFQDFLGKHAYEFIKYGIFDVKDRINNLFLKRLILPPEDKYLEFLVTSFDSHSQQANTYRDSSITALFMGSIEALKKENASVLSTISMHVDEYVLDEDQTSVPKLHCGENLLVDSLSSGIINNLRESVKQMALNGFEKEFLHAYSSWRREFLKESLRTFDLQFQELNMEDTDNMEKIDSWIKALNVAARILFPNERKLCNRVFKGSISSWESVFTEVCTELATSLLSTGLALATWSPFIRNTLQELIQDFESCTTLRNDAVVLIRKRLRIYEALENVSPVPSGGLHPITLEVMYYIYSVYRMRGISKLGQDLEEGKIPLPVYMARMRELLESKSSLEGNSKNYNNLEVMYNIYSVYKNRGSKLSHGLEEGKLSSPVYIARMTELLETSLEANSKNYNNPTLGYVFIINNRRFIELDAKLNGQEPIFGYDWLQNNTTKFQQNLELYQRTSWNKIVDFLKLDINESEPIVAAELMKDKLHWFNKHFDETCNVQSEFLGKHAYEYIKYGMLDVQDQLNNLFL
ncbi:Exocyst complex component EXO70B1, partial [Mucuna pruriens]